MSPVQGLDRYRQDIEDGLRRALAGDGALARIARYHVGFEDVDGHSAAALGKLLRPSLALFTTTECGGRLEDALPAAVGLELIHSFSLVHDDIQDCDRVRRGRPAVWTIWGISEAINAGDYLHAAATRTIVTSGLAATTELAWATSAMIEGQSMDLAFENEFVGEDAYIEMIDRKTGALFRCAFALGGICAGAVSDVLDRLRSLGREVGRAFQVQDDLLGIWGDGDALGKPIGSDIRRRKKSFPLAASHARADDAARAQLEAIFSGDVAGGETGGEVGDEDVAWVIALMDRLDVRAVVEQTVDRHTQEALVLLDGLPFSEDGRTALRGLIEALARRDR